MTLNQLLYFQAVAKYEHFRLAAASLNISQPSLSRSIANLEEELGIILFERKGRTVTLTKYGRFFLEHANRILSDVRLAEKQMKKLSGSSGHVDIAYVFPLAAQYIPRNVRRFLAKSNNSKISFNFHQTYTGEMVSGLKSEKYDVIFGSYVENEPGIQFVPILKQEMIIITPLRSWDMTERPGSGGSRTAHTPPTPFLPISSVNLRTRTLSPRLWRRISASPWSRTWTFSAIFLWKSST